MIPLALLLNRYTAGAAALAVVAAGAFWYRGELIQTGYDRAMGEVRVAQAELARKQIREADRLIGVLQGLYDEAQKQKQTVADFRSGQRAAVQRLRDQEAEFDSRIATAEAQALRRYAKTADGDLGRCREHVERLGLEAVQCSIAAHTLKGYVDALP